MTVAPLEGIRVVSFGTGAVIPEWGKTLGEFGADVIKIESKENPDFVRTIGPDMNNIHGFNESNRSQRSFGVNLKTEKGKELVRRLIMTADMVANTEAARLLTYQAAMHIDVNNTAMIPRFCAMAKYTASDTAMKVTTDAVQVMGGYGYMKDYPVERMMRDAKLTQIYEGTNQINRIVSGRGLMAGSKMLF